MAEQETLIDPVTHSLWTRYVHDGVINETAWLQACNDGGYVGTCPCGQYLIPRRPHRVNNSRTDYEARCRPGGCGRIICAPGGRLLGRPTTAKASQGR